METLKWHGLIDLGDDLCICIRGAQWDVICNEVAGHWQVRTPNSNVKHEKQPKLFMRKWRIIE